MKSTSSIKGFLTTKKLLDQDKKTLSKDASQKSLSRASARLKAFEDALDGRTPPRANFQETDREQDFEDIGRTVRPEYASKFSNNIELHEKPNGSSPYRRSKARLVE